MPAVTLRALGGFVSVSALPPDWTAITALAAALVGARTPTVQAPEGGDAVGHEGVVAPTTGASTSASASSSAQREAVPRVSDGMMCV